MSELEAKGATLKYKTIYMELKDLIQNGRFMTGSFLPTEAQLMETYQVSRTTVRKAVAELQEEGLVRVHQGRGTEVISGKTSVPPRDLNPVYAVKELTERFLVDGKKETTGSVVDVIQADAKLADCLKTERHAAIYRIQRLKYCNDIPYDYVVSYVPGALAPNLDRFSGQSFRLKRLLRDEYGLESVRAEEYYHAVTASFMKANLLHVQVGEPLVVVTHTAYNETDVIEYTESFICSKVYWKGMVLDGGIGISREFDRDDEETRHVEYIG